MADMKDKVDMKGVENAVADALKPVGERPRIVPSPVKAPVDDESQKWREEWPNKPAAPPYEPVRTITQFLMDIEKIADRLTIRQEDTEKNLATILHSIDSRLGLVLDRIGVLENMLGVR